MDEACPLPPAECYQAMGFRPFDGGPHLLAAEWRALQSTNLLEGMRKRYVLWREFAGQPLVDEGFVVGWVPPMRLATDEFSKLLQALDIALAAGCQSVAEWQAFKQRGRV